MREPPRPGLMLGLHGGVEDRHGAGSGRRFPMAVNPWNPDDPRASTSAEAGATPLRGPHRPAPPARPVETAVGDTVDAAFAVLAVAVAMGRYAVEVGVRVPRSAARRLPVVGIPGPGGWRAAVGR